MDTGTPPAGPGAGQGPCRALVSLRGKVGTVAGLVPPPLLPPGFWLQVASPQILFREEKSLGCELRQWYPQRHPQGQGHPQGHPLLLMVGSCPNPCGSSLAPTQGAACHGSCATGDLGHPLGTAASPPLLFTPGHAQLLPFTEIWGCKWEFCKGSSCKCGSGAVHSGGPPSWVTHPCARNHQNPP